MNIIQWKEINGFSNYEVSTSGIIRRIKDKREVKQVIRKGHSSKYYRVQLWNNGKPSSKSVHRLVAEQFLPNFYNKPTVDHKNRESLDNRLINLRWATREQQVKNRVLKNPKYIIPNIYLTNASTFLVRLHINHKSYQKTFKKIEEAVKWRDELITNLN